MRILVVGSGGREHALAWKLAQEAEVLCAPGNPGIAEDCEVVQVAANDFPALVRLAQERHVNLVVVGPEDPLVDGLADTLREAGIPTYGPSRAGAQLEASKAFSKELMRDAGVPTAHFETFTDPELAKEYARLRFADGRPVAVKASGNALGKGVVVCDDPGEAEAAIDQMMVQRIFGEAGATVVIEDRLGGPEFSLITIVGDENFVSLPVAQDHKRAHDGDQGPNTGGMGTYSPVDWVTEELIAHTEERIVRPVLLELKKRGITYRGTLFSGVMMDGAHPYCLEYNVRFGDPETQSLMLRIGRGLAAALEQAARGEVIDAPEILSNASATVVVASGGYPLEYRKGLPIHLGAVPAGAKVFHAGTATKDGQLVTNGGRVFGAAASAPDLARARSLAYEAAREIRFEGAFYRKDIGPS
jgi:phosphoribosylamine--glycine ligase